MKYICAFFYGGIHRSVYISKSKPPFNPVLGETYQAKNADGCRIYMEQTLHHPPTFNFHLVEENKKFELMGFGSITAHLDTPNQIRGWREGKNIMKLNGELFSWINLKTRISGIIMGDRVYNFYDDMVIKDYKNKIECVVSVPDEINEGMLSKVFSKKKEIQYDEAKIEIRKLNPETKQKEVVAKGFGSWIGQIYFGEKCYWSVLDEQQNWENDDKYVIPSDGTKRSDLNFVLKNEMDNAQIEKEKIEELQRTDQKLREDYKAKTGNK